MDLYLKIINDEENMTIPVYALVIFSGDNQTRVLGNGKRMS